MWWKESNVGTRRIYHGCTTILGSIMGVQRSLLIDCGSEEEGELWRNFRRLTRFKPGLLLVDSGGKPKLRPFVWRDHESQALQLVEKLIDGEVGERNNRSEVSMLADGDRRFWERRQKKQLLDDRRWKKRNLQQAETTIVQKWNSLQRHSRTSMSLQRQQRDVSDEHRNNSVRSWGKRIWGTKAERGQRYGKRR